MPLYNPPVAGGGGASIVPRGRAKFGGNAQLAMPGAPPGTNSAFTATVNRAQYSPLIVESAITIDQIVCEVTTSAAQTIRLGLYNADTDWQPTTLVAGTDAGAIDASTTGVKTQALSDTVLAAGRYLAWINASGAGVVLRSIIASADAMLGYPTALGSNTGIAQIYAAQTFGAAPSTGLVWDTTFVTSPVNFQWYTFLRIKTP